MGASVPPQMATSALPQRMSSAAMAMASMPAAHADDNGVTGEISGYLEHREMVVIGLDPALVVALPALVVVVLGVSSMRYVRAGFATLQRLEP